MWNMVTVCFSRLMCQLLAQPMTFSVASGPEIIHFYIWRLYFYAVEKSLLKSRFPLRWLFWLVNGLYWNGQRFRIVFPCSVICETFKFGSIFCVFTRIFALLFQVRFSLSPNAHIQRAVCWAEIWCTGLVCTWCQVYESERVIWTGSQWSWGVQLVWGRGRVKVLLFLKFIDQFLQTPNVWSHNFSLYFLANLLQCRID